MRNIVDIIQYVLSVRLFCTTLYAYNLARKCRGSQSACALAHGEVLHATSTTELERALYWVRGDRGSGLLSGRRSKQLFPPYTCDGTTPIDFPDSVPRLFPKSRNLCKARFADLKPADSLDAASLHL